MIAAVAGLTLFFKPLLWGIARALVLTFAPRRSRIGGNSWPILFGLAQQGCFQARIDRLVA